MAAVNGLAQKDISSAFAGLGSDFLSSADLAKLQESTMKDLSRFMDKPVPQQKPIETAPNPFMRKAELNPAYASLKRAADQRAAQREENAKASSKNAFDGEKQSILGTAISFFARKDKSSEKSPDSWDNGPVTA